MRQTILQVVQHLRPGGIETMALELMKQLLPEHDIHIVSLEGEQQAALKAWPRLALYKSQLHFLNKEPGIHAATFSKLFTLIKHLNPSVIHTHHIGPLFYAGIMGKICHLTTHIHTEHDAWHLLNKKHQSLQGQLLKIVKPVLVADCHQVAAQLVHHFPQQHPVVILNGIDVDSFVPPLGNQKQQQRKKLGLPERGFLIGCAARLEEVKNHAKLLRSISCIDADVSLVLAGDGSLRQSLVNMCRDLGISDKVYFLGALNDVLPFYQSIDLFCLASNHEGLPLSPLEAQACAVPTILTDVGGCKSIICPTTGQLIEANNPVMLQRAILKQLSLHKHLSPRPFALNVGSLSNTAKAYNQLFCAKKA